MIFSSFTNCSIQLIELGVLMLRYKQATCGDCNTGRPGGWDLKGQRKWDAWNSVRGTPVAVIFLIIGMSGHEARERYVSLVKELFNRQGDRF